MEKQLKKLKSKSIIIIIIAMLTITWQLISYLTLKDVINFEDFTSSQTLIIYTSYFILAIFILAVISLIFTVFRVIIKYKSVQKKMQKSLESKNENLEVERKITNKK